MEPVELLRNIPKVKLRVHTVSLVDAAPASRLHYRCHGLKPDHHHHHHPHNHHHHVHL